MTSKWIAEHVTAVTEALCDRMRKEGCTRRWQVVYHPSGAGYRGGLTVVPQEQATADPAWLPVDGPAHFRDLHVMTRQQIAATLLEASRSLPILDPLEA